MIASWFTTIVCATALAAAAADEATPLAQREEAALAAAARGVAPSVVGVETLGGLERGEGELTSAGRATGLILTPDGYIVTSLFQFTGETSGVLVSLPDGTRVPAKLVARDFRCRLALLKVHVDERLPTPVLAPMAQVRVGQWAVAVGRALEAQEANLSVGIVSGLNRIWGTAIQTDAKISPHNYGGPLVDVRGRVIGVLAPLSQDKQNAETDTQWYDAGIGFAVPIDQVMALLPRWQQGTDLKMGLVGVAQKQGDLFADPPVLASVRPNSPAAKAGLKANDRIVGVDKLPIDRQIDFTRELNRRYAGDTVHVTIRRGSETLERDMTLVDHLLPYARPFVGVLLARGEESEPGVTVRYVYEESPAAKTGIMAGDRLLRFGEQAIEGRAELAAIVAASSAGNKVKIEFTRSGAAQSVELTLAAEPDAVPASLPALPELPAPVAGAQPAVGQLPLRSATVDNEGLLYVPEDFDHRAGYGLLVWLHGDEGFDADSLLARWRELCQQHRFVLLAPMAKSKKRWASEDLDMLKGALDLALADYQLDPLRVAVHGQQSGGAIGSLLTFARREQVRGLAVIQSPIFGQVPDNDPEYRLWFFVASPASTQLDKLIKRVRELKYPLVSRPLEAKAAYLNDAQLGELLRWFDSLDRI
ncbi:MAG: PDZ domain-containing protein [Planctomycetes bacterium]|nr:PDZ domain-containing protein [Planctomycetota bacterium]